MQETGPERASPIRQQVYRVNTGKGMPTFERAIEVITADANRLLGDIAIRLDRLEKRLDALEQRR